MEDNVVESDSLSPDNAGVNEDFEEPRKNSLNVNEKDNEMGLNSEEEQGREVITQPLESNGFEENAEAQSHLNQENCEGEIFKGKAVDDEKLVSENFDKAVEKPVEKIFDAESRDNQENHKNVASESRAQNGVLVDGKAQLNEVSGGAQDETPVGSAAQNEVLVDSESGNEMIMDTDAQKEVSMDNGVQNDDSLLGDSNKHDSENSLENEKLHEASNTFSQNLCDDNKDNTVGERGIPEGESEEPTNEAQYRDLRAVAESVSSKDEVPVSENETLESEKTDNVELSMMEPTDSGADGESKDIEKDNEPLDILGNGLLKKTVITEGEGEETRPQSGNEVVIKVSGELSNGESLNEEEITFILDEREVIQAFDLAVALMELGEKASLYTDAKYAYGPFGCNENGLKIPPHCNITYEIEVMSIREILQDAVPDEEKLSIGDRKRSRGNSFYKRGDYGGAIDCYKRALKYLEGSSNKNVSEMHLKCQNNLSAAQLKVNAFQAALLSCNSVLRAEPENVKAVFRKGKCLESLGDSEEALKWMKKASMLDPNSKMIQAELIRLGNYVKKNRQKESDMYKRMVDGLRDQDKENASENYSFSWKILAGTMMAAGVGIMAAFFLYRH